MEIKLVIDKKTLDKYYEQYFKKYPKRKKKLIEKPIPPSLNQWMIMPRHQMNHYKQAWKELGEWLVEYSGYKNFGIQKCHIIIEYFFDSNRRHDPDNFTPKNLFDAFVSSGLLVDDDFSHVESLTLLGNYSKDNPRTEILFIIEDENKWEKLISYLKSLMNNG